VFKLIESAQARWRCVNAPYLVPLVRAAATFANGKLVERPDDQDQQEGEQKSRETPIHSLDYCSWRVRWTFPGLSRYLTRLPHSYQPLWTSTPEGHTAGPQIASTTRDVAEPSS
jgi:hypothetical protein